MTECSSWQSPFVALGDEESARVEMRRHCLINYFLVGSFDERYSCSLHLSDHTFVALNRHAEFLFLVCDAVESNLVYQFDRSPFLRSAEDTCHTAYS